MASTKENLQQLFSTKLQDYSPHVTELSDSSLLLAFDTPSFRAHLQLEDQLIEHIQSPQWLFCDEILTDTFEVDKPTAPIDLCFLIRVDRKAYQYMGVEANRYLVNQIATMMVEAGTQAYLYVGRGWWDLILIGEIKDKPADLLPIYSLLRGFSITLPHSTRPLLQAIVPWRTAEIGGEDLYPYFAESPEGDESSCACSSTVLVSHSKIKSLRKLFPSELYTGLNSARSRLSVLLSDRTICCDRVDLVKTIDGVLVDHLHELQKIEKLAETGTERAFAWKQDCLDEIADWCKEIPEIVSQYSTEPLHERKPSNSSSRNAPTKTLILAQWLVAEHVKMICEHVFHRKKIAPPVVRYSTRENCKSILGGRVILLPYKYQFSLNLCIHELWSLAGVRIFYAMYPKDSPNLVEKRKIDFELQLEAESRFEEGLLPKPPSFAVDPYEQVADQFSDLSVRYFACRSLQDFSLTFLSDWLRVIKTAEMPERVREQCWVGIFLRLTVVAQCEAILKKKGKLETISSRGLAASQNRRDNTALEDNTLFEFLFFNLFNLREISKATDSTLLPEEDGLSEVVRMLRSKAFYTFHYQFMWDFIEEIENHDSVKTEIHEIDESDIWQELDAGGLVDLGDWDVDRPESFKHLSYYFSRGASNNILVHGEGAEFNSADIAAIERSVYFSFYKKNFVLEQSCDDSFSWPEVKITSSSSVEHQPRRRIADVLGASCKNILSGLSRELLNFSGSGRVALIIKRSETSTAQVYDPYGLVAEHCEIVSDTFAGEFWPMSEQDLRRALPSGRRWEPISFTHERLLGYGSQSIPIFYQMWITEQQAKGYSQEPIEALLKEVCSILQSCVHNNNLEKAIEASYGLKERTPKVIRKVLERRLHGSLLSVKKVEDAIINLSRASEESKRTTGTLAFVAESDLKRLNFILRWRKDSSPSLRDPKHICKLLAGTETPTDPYRLGGQFLISTDESIVGFTERGKELSGRHHLCNLQRR